MRDKPELLLVDDSPNEIRILMEILKQDYRLNVATNGAQALEMIAETTPDLVLMDVVMEPMDGYEACSRLKLDWPELPVIFVSANTETDEILKGFAAGGQDYITKPFEPKILLRKVRLTLSQTAQRLQLSSEKREATAMVMAAMNSAADISVVVNFLRACTKHRDAQALVQEICRASANFGVQVCSRIVGVAEKPFYAASQGAVQPLEQVLMDRASEFECRMLEKGNRLILKFSSVVMLVKNLPEEPSRAGELKDYLLILMEAAHDLNQRITADTSVAQQRLSLMMDTIDKSRVALQEIKDFQVDHKEKNLAIMNQLMLEIETGFVSMGLSEEQEVWIAGVIKNKLDESLAHLESGLTVDRKLHGIVEQLDALVQTF
ncbi:response regulator [Shewanella amazonensis]|uniref:Response regulator receiver protein n=1 Tax=Shewanella amazonensis (strain ATCC BAA-1098 / SB2B) TaxID=326297 RepID=A1SBP0_SHEAM|nr:response regulator [Shewanella amazonensis]ABM01797.1 response regulator receiver protein [Shewanella amazonensis SB2B]